MKILIADDEPLARMRIRALVNEIGGHDIIEEDASNGKEVLQLVKVYHPQVVLLDIGMPGINGMQAAEQIAKMTIRPSLIFTTAYGEYALDAFEQQAVDYLLKPIRKERLQKALEKAERLQQACIDTPLASSSEDEKTTRGARTHISALSQGNTLLIPVDKIYYFQADQKYVTLRWTEGEVLIDESLKNLEAEFSGQFLRIHRNALVALVYVAKLTKDKQNHHFIGFENLNIQLEISRRHLQNVKKTLRDMSGKR